MVSVPVGTIPLWLLGILCLSTVPYLGVYLKSYWSRLALSCLIMSALFGTAISMLALLLSMRTADAASHVFRFAAPTFLILGIALLHTTYGLLERGVPKWLRLLWRVGILWAIGALVLGPSWDTLRANADGYFWAPAHQSIPLLGIEAGDLALVGSILVIVVRELFRRQVRRYRTYAWALIFLTVPFFLNDIVLVRIHRTVFPTLWIPLFVYGVIMWYEVRRRVTHTDRLMRTDTLTGALTRGYGTAMAAQRVRLLGTGALYLDVDDFKRVNDTFGHASGDKLLQRLVGQLQTACREDDLLIRLGGDEFAVVVTDVPETRVADIAERVRNLFEERPLMLSRGRKQLLVTVSIGWAWSTDRSLEDLMERADRAMYDVKHERKQRLAGGAEGAPSPAP